MIQRQLQLPGRLHQPAAIIKNRGPLVVGLLRPINRIGAHCSVSNSLIKKGSSTCGTAVAACHSHAVHSGEDGATEQCAPAPAKVRDRLTTPLIPRFKLVRNIDSSDCKPGGDVNDNEDSI
jgi:hypothetical protein